MKEKDIQKFLVDWLDKTQPDLEYFSVPNEGAWKRRDLSKMGLTRGVADLVFWGMKNAPLAFVELKLKKGRQSNHQKDFMAACEHRRIPYKLIKTNEPEEALTILQGYIGAWTK